MMNSRVNFPLVNQVAAFAYHGITHCSYKKLLRRGLGSVASFYDSQARLKRHRHYRGSAAQVPRRTQYFCTKPMQSEPFVQAKSSVMTEGLTKSSDSMDSIIGGMEKVEEEPIDRRALIELEVELLRQEANKVPDVITEIQWNEILTKPSRSARKKYLRFLFLNQMKRENLKRKKEVKRIEREKEMEFIDMSKDRYVSDDGHIQYGLWCNTIFLRIQDTTMNHFYNSRVMSAMIHGQPIVFDLGFEEHMTSKERQNCASQIVGSYASNRIHPDPFYIHLCNAERNIDTMQRLLRFMPPLYDDDFPMTVSAESYLDVFPKDKLVYLTPHCREELNEFDHDAVYIIGGLVDLAESEPLSLAKARKEGIQMKKFPLERYLDWGLGGKSLTVNQVMNIMLDLKHTDDWHYALRHIPRRKLKPADDSQERLEKYLKKNLRRRDTLGDREHNDRLRKFYAD